MSQSSLQFTTFYLGSDLFGIDVMRVQEITQNTTVVHVPLAPEFVRGLVNLRGQIATALGLRQLFGLEAGLAEDQMSVVCKMEGNLVSLLVDSIGDVLEVQEEKYEPAPDTVDSSIRKYLKGVYKIDGNLLSILDVDRLSNELSNSIDLTEINKNNGVCCHD